jgi:hypothetical protein
MVLNDSDKNHGKLNYNTHSRALYDLKDDVKALVNGGVLVYDNVETVGVIMGFNGLIHEFAKTLAKDGVEYIEDSMSYISECIEILKKISYVKNGHKTAYIKKTKFSRGINKILSFIDRKSTNELVSVNKLFHSANELSDSVKVLLSIEETFSIDTLLKFKNYEKILSDIYEDLSKNNYDGEFSDNVKKSVNEIYVNVADIFGVVGSLFTMYNQTVDTTCNVVSVLLSTSNGE